MTQIDIELSALQAFANLAQTKPTDAVKMRMFETSPEVFQNRTFGAVWNFMKRAVEAGQKLDVVTAIKTLETVAPRELVANILSSNEPPLMADERIAKVREMHTRRVAIDGLRKVAMMLKDSSIPVEAAMLELQGVKDAAPSGEPFRSMQDEVMKIIERQEQIERGEIEPVIPTGCKALDDAIGGFQPTLMIIGAYPGVGKSALVAGMARNLGSRKTTCGLISIEDEAIWQPYRVVSEASGIPVFVAKHKRLTLDQKNRFASACEQAWKISEHILVDDRSGLTVSDVVESARGLARRGAKVIILDHLGEIKLDRTDRHDLEVSEALSELRRISKVYKIAVVVVCHMKRKESQSIFEAPALTDFAFSAGIERMARVALGLWREEGNDAHIKCTILKQTDGVANVCVDLPFTAKSGIVTDETKPQWSER